MSEPDVEIPESGKIILSSDEDDMDEKMLENTLNSFGVQHGTIMIVEDFQVENSIFFTMTSYFLNDTKLLRLRHYRIRQTIAQSTHHDE